MKDLSRRALFGLIGAGLLTTAGISAAEAEVVVYERAMPGMRVEAVPPPRAGYGWVPGHWVWRGGWVWVPGHRVHRASIRPMPAPVVEVVTVRPSPRHYWVKGHWDWSDRRGDWIWIRGRWIR